MGISDKIEAIRKQPLHIRVRYVWGCVFVSMAFILLIWLLSISVMFRGKSKNASQTSDLNDLKNSIESSKKDLPKLEDLPKDYPQQ